MTQVKDGDNVKVHYTGKLNDGSVFDSSEGRDPLEFTVGEGQVIPGFEDAVVGMTIGDIKTITIPADQAYGPHHEGMVVEVGKEQLPPEFDPQIGDQLQMQHPSGQVLVVNVTEVSDETITLDGNHPLAGKDLTFDIKLESVD